MTRLSLFVMSVLGISLPAQALKVAPGKHLPTTRAEIAGYYEAGSSSWQQFLNTHSGEWITEWCAATGTPSAIFGTGIPLDSWRVNTLEEGRHHAGLLLKEQSDLLGLGTSEFRESIGARMGRTWSFVYDQYFHGLQVIGGRADVRVNMVGRVAMFGASAWPIPANFNVTPRLDGDTAAAFAWQAFGRSPNGVSQPARVAGPRLVIWGDVRAQQLAPFFLAWEVSISNVDRNGDGPIGRYYVDANTGAILHYTSDKHDCNVVGCNYNHLKADAVETAGPTAPLAAPVNTTVTVMGWTRTGNDALSALVNVPLPGLQLTVPGVGAVTTDNNGQFTVNIAAATSIAVGALDGRHHGVMVGANAPGGLFTINPGVAATIQLLTNAATFNQAAHTTTSWWTDRTNEFCRSILGNSVQLNTADAIVPTLNIASSCNAYYTANTINFYQAGGGCSNTAFSTVVAHEWGHGLDDRYGGISQTQGLSEGWGDIIALYLVDNPVLGSGFQTAGVGIRDGNNTRQYPPPAEVHDAGEVWMGFAWQLRNRLATTLGSRPAAITLTNTIVLGSIVANAFDQPSAVREVFLADDNDGNLNNGTPHSADLIWACNQKRLPYPGMPRPSNDECTGAIALANGWNGPFDSVTASNSSPAWACGAGGADLWFSFVATHSGPLMVSTCGGAAWDTQIELLGGNCGTLTSIACNDDSCALQSAIQANVTPGTYYVRVGGYLGDAGVFYLNVAGPNGTPASVQTGGLAGYYSQQLNAIQRNVPLGQQSSVAYSGSRVSVRFLDGTARNVTGFQLYLSSNLAGSNVRNAYLYDATGSNNRPNNRLLTGKIGIGNGMRLCRASFEGLYRVQGNTLYYMSFDLLPGETVRMGTTTAGGAASVTVWNSATFTNEPIVYGVNTDGRHAGLSSSLPLIGRRLIVDCRVGEPGGWAALYVGSSLLPTPIDPWYSWNRGPGSFLFVSPDASAGIIGLNGAGDGSLAFDLPNSPVLAGLHAFTQWQVSTPSNGYGFSNFADLGFGF